LYLSADQAFVLSDKTVQLLQKQQKLTNSLILRYKILIDNSPAGRNCHVAAQALRFINKDQEVQKLRQYLQDLRAQVDHLLQHIDSLVPEPPEYEL